MERADIMSCDDLVEAIKEHGLYPRGNGAQRKFWFGPEADHPSRGMGALAWQHYFAMLDHAGFDYWPYIGSRYGYRKSKPHSEARIESQIEEKIDELIDLLSQYRALQAS